ncbi:hypothetical protein [Paenibacillus sp. FSL K6-1318]|uniref:hypothetical protein n=1 Tax=Paenibacillus sp. FSL K6-1318 TaxID=2975291 RepID=UPI0030ED8C50
MKQGWTVEFLCKYFLEWEWIISFGEKIDARFEELYEPIILLFERGGELVTTIMNLFVENLDGLKMFILFQEQNLVN